MKQLAQLDWAPGYSVQEDGSVWSLWGQGWRGAGRIIKTTWHKLKPYKNTKGYLKVDLMINGVRNCLSVHRLVLMVYLPKFNSKLETRHLNGIKTDNRLCNLAQGTAKENYADRVRHGTDNSGGRAGKAKLTTEDVELIRDLRRDSHLTQKRIGQIFGVHKGTIQSILNGRNWKCVGL